ncbi:hypothetical protein F444_13786 [Phytophthora nicotianae P1976]|uniref:RxLR effector protein n=1 Tax=Phytophthora nicotianae P1976 TaxID=1317066 RepID=A0A080ZSP8_PHYNI|nr:hypothetical protein F444_13786 [Phytophthora nicotianae P1976]
MRFSVVVASLMVILGACCNSVANAENVVFANIAGNRDRRLRSEVVNPDVVSKNVATFASKLMTKVQAKKNAAAFVTELQKVQVSKNVAKFATKMKKVLERERSVPLVSKVYKDEAAVKYLLLQLSSKLDNAKFPHKDIIKKLRDA